MPATAAQIINQFGLAPLPHEGGFFRRTWTSDVTLPGGRPAGSAIYFLVTPDGFSALHRLRTPELWLFHAGDALEHLQLAPSAAILTSLGTDFTAGQVPQLLVPAGVWQGARLAAGGAHGWSLISCTMAPGWDDAEFELGARAPLVREFPASAPWIEALTR